MSASVLWRWFRGSPFPGGEFRWFSNHAFRYQHQIRSDVIESGVHIPHLNQSLIGRNQLRISKVSPFELRIQLLSMTAFGYSLTTELTSCSPRVTYLPGLIVFLHKMASRWYGLSPKIPFARALRYTDWLLPSFSDSLILSGTRSAFVIAFTIDHYFLCLGNLPWTLHIFPSSVHTFELSVFIIANQ